MGARTLVRFVRGDGAATSLDKVLPMIYLHWGGPPEIMAVNFEEFFLRVERDGGKDTRYNDPEYLAARFVVFASVECGTADDPGSLGFTGVGVTATTVVKAIEAGSFTYAVDCSGNGPRLRPKILVDEVLFTDTHEVAHHSVCTIEEYLDAQRKNEEEDNAQLV
jgi:hypothetical protein